MSSRLNTKDGITYIPTDGGGAAATIGNRTKCASLSFEYNICNKMKEHHYIHRLEKLPTSASKANSDKTKSTKTQAHQGEPYKNRKNSGTLLDT